MLRRIVVLSAAVAASAALAGPAQAFSIEHPRTGECRQILVPGEETFPGNWEVVSSTPAEAPGPWNGHHHANDNSAHGPVVCP
jgi:hypothetical protein